MANKLAGQRAKFNKARATFYSTSDEEQRRHAAKLMAEVFAEAPANGFDEAEVTQGEHVPDEARDLVATVTPAVADDNPDVLGADSRKILSKLKYYLGIAIFVILFFLGSAPGILFLAGSPSASGLLFYFNHS